MIRGTDLLIGNINLPRLREELITKNRELRAGDSINNMAALGLCKGCSKCPRILAHEEIRDHLRYFSFKILT
jgi:hypothetical protein